jgi:FKBP-type peptidyl-prolyl cis-trans isomerase
VLVKYSGWLASGSQATPFDSGSITVNMGKPEVIAGWSAGLKGACAGERRLLRIPARLAYGGGAKPGIPANSDLHFATETLSIESAADRTARADVHLVKLGSAEEVWPLAACHTNERE